MPALGPLALAAGKFLGRGALIGVGFGAGKKLMGGGKEKDTQQEANQSFTDKVQERGKQAASAGAAYAQAQQASQQRMEERGQQMADKAKAGSQIATGEAMDMSWQMLKAWSFLPGFDEFDKRSIIEHAKKMKLQHVSIHDLGHHDKRFNERYKPNQEMPKGAEKLAPRDLALAYMDLMLRRSPDLIERGNQKSKVGGKDEFGEPHPDNFPGISFPLLQTDEPIRSQVKTDKGRMIEEYHPVFAAGHAHHEPSEHPKFALVTANDLPTQAGNRNTLGVTHTINRYSHEHFPIVDQAASDAFYQPEGVSTQAQNKRVVAEEAQRRHEGDFMQPVDVERMRQQGLGRSMTEQQATQRVLGANPLAVSHQNPLLAFPQSKLRQEYQQYLAQQQAQEQKNEAQAAVPRIQPAGNGFVFFNGQLMREEDVPVETGEPMDIAMQLLKMPLIPYSLKEREGGYTGQFQDPITDEIMPLHLDGDIDEEYGISANIPERANTEVTGSSLFGSARATEDSATEPDYQRRGYMTALYDALAAMLDKKHFSTLYPNSVQSEEGRKFWGDKESWPVRDDILETGEPMDMAWRMLKGELQLPHQITEALRGDLTTLDRAHKMTDTNEGTLIENIHPDMENVVKLLAEKHMGDISPTMQRPVMPLFHSPFH